MPAVIVKDPAASAEWPATQPIGAIDYEDYSQVATRPVIAIPRVVQPRPASVMPAAPTPTPTTVIPVPALPTMRSTGLTRRLEPVVRTIPEHQAASPRRFSKGTGPVGPATTRNMAAISEDTVPHLSFDDQTRPGIAMVAARTAAMPSQDDRTRPGIALPPAARAVELPSIVRRTSSR